MINQVKRKFTIVLARIQRPRTAELNSIRSDLLKAAFLACLRGYLEHETEQILIDFRAGATPNASVTQNFAEMLRRRDGCYGKFFADLP